MNATSLGGERWAGAKTAGAIVLFSTIVVTAAVVWGAETKDPFVVPDAKPPALLGFIARMRKLQPPRASSDDEKQAFAIKAHTAMNEAADKILATKPKGKPELLAVEAKIEALTTLDKLGDGGAKKQLADLAEIYRDEAGELGRVVQPYIGIAGKESAKADAAPKPWEEIRPKLAAAPEDKALARQALQSVGEMEYTAQPDAAVKAYLELKAIFAKSRDPQIATVAPQLDGVVRRLSLPGKPIEIRGNLVDGSPVNTRALKGKVVLVDFWATWCGPCREELPNVLANYEKYHSRGFEVVGVSIDDDKNALLKFISDKKLPWPITFSDRASGPGMADYYSVHSVPTAILTNQKGEVVSLHARGPELSRLLQQMLGK